MKHLNDVRIVVKNSLCTGCGTCESICTQSAISVSWDKHKDLLVPNIDIPSCNSCGLCLKFCPGWQINFSLLSENALHRAIMTNLSNADTAYYAFSTDYEHRFNCSSGGMVTELLIYLLQTARIDGAVVTRFTSNGAPSAIAYVANSPDDIFAGRGSKYCPVALNKRLREWVSSGVRHAYVGLPCQVAGLRKLQEADPIYKSAFPYVLGLFCSRSPTARATSVLLRRIGVSADKIVNLAYRGNGYPGKFKVQLVNNHSLTIPHQDPRYWGHAFLKYFRPARCWLCPDHSASLADISFADNKIRSLRRDPRAPEGASNIIVRSDEMLDTLEEMKEAGLVVLEPVEIGEVEETQHLREKANLPPRVALWRITGHAVPSYVPSVHEVKAKDIMSELPEFLRVIACRSIHSVTFWTYYLRLRQFLYNSVVCMPKKFVSRIKRILSILAKTRYFIPVGLVRRSASGDCHQILVTGGFGHADIGDEAMPMAVLDNIKERLGNANVEFVMLSPNPESTMQDFGVRAITHLLGLPTERPIGKRAKFELRIKESAFLWGARAKHHGIDLLLWPSARAVLNELINVDLVFNVGGGNLNSMMWQSLHQKGLLYLAAAILGKPIIVSGQTIGPFDEDEDHSFALKAFDSVNLVTLRDKETSLQRLAEIGVKGTKIQVAADDAMTLKATNSHEVRHLVSSVFPAKDVERECLVVLNIKGSLRSFSASGKSQGMSGGIAFMAELADRLVTEFGVVVLFVPTGYGEVTDDRILHREIYKRMLHRVNAACLEEFCNARQLKGIIGLADVAIGSRYHFCVFAASQRVPFLGLASGTYQQTKLHGLAQLCGLPGSYSGVDLLVDSVDEVWPKVSELMRSRKTIRTHLDSVVSELKKRSLISIDRACDILTSRKVCREGI